MIRALDPKPGDLVTAYIIRDREGHPTQDRLTARVLWPRETYVRARIFGIRPKPNGVRPRVIVDVPRQAIAGVINITASSSASI